MLLREKEHSDSHRLILHLISFLIKTFIKTHRFIFYAVDMAKKELNLLEGENAGLVTLDISQAENMAHSNTLLPY